MFSNTPNVQGKAHHDDDYTTIEDPFCTGQ